MNDFEKIKKELETEYQKVSKKYWDADNKMRIYVCNDFETRAMQSILIGMLVYVLIVVVLLPKIVSINLISMNLIKPLSILVSGTLGFLGQELFNHFIKVKTRLNKFTKSKNEKDLLEEYIRNEIEKTKNLSLLEALTKTYNEISTKGKFVSELTNDYEISLKEENNILDLEKNIENINTLLENKQKNMDILAAKCVLKENFWRVRDKLQTFMDYPLIIMGAFALGMFFYNAPSIVLNVAATGLEIFIPGLVTAVISTSYAVKKYKNKKEVFNKINSELGENALSSKRNFDEDNLLDQKLREEITNFCSIKMHLEAEKRKLENLLSKSENTIKNKFANEQDSKKIDEFCSTLENASVRVRKR